MKRIVILCALLTCAVAVSADAPRPITQLTRQSSDPFEFPAYLSRGVETRVFEGCFIAVDPEESVAIQLISDDGCDMYIDGRLVLANFRRPQHLPDASQSVKRYPAEGGIKYGAGTHQIRVEYSNILYLGEHLDIDGCTLVAPGLRFFKCKDVATGGSHGNNGVGNGQDPPPPGNPPVNDGAGTGPGNPGNQGGTPGQGGSASSGSSGGSAGGGGGSDNAGPKGNNGVGNGVDPAPPGNPPVNDGAGTGPGNPGNKGGAKP